MTSQIRSRSRTFLSLLLSEVVLSACGEASADRDVRNLAAAIDSLVELTLTASPAPGIGVAVVQAGDTVVMRGYGLANLEHGVPVTDRTVFHIASVNKVFTAGAVMRLVDEGRLRLDPTVAELLPEHDGPAGSVTVHQLLSHTSGIPDYIRTLSTFGEPPLSPAEMEAVFRQPLHFPPGTGDAYSSSGYYLLGRMVEAAAWPETFREQIRTGLVAPLGREQTGVCERDELVPHRAQGYHTRPRRLVNAPWFAPNELGSDGGICSTARDLVRWMRGLAGGEVVSEASYRRMTEPTRIGEREVPAGYGVRLRALDGAHPHVWHTGGMLSFTAVLAHYPEADLTIAILANGPLNLLPLKDRIARLALGVPEADNIG
jgi:D-alanyl-D-alanine carboxypeptidase